MLANNRIREVYQVRAILETLTDEQKQLLTRLLVDSNYHPEQSMDELKIKSFYESIKAKIDEG